MITNEEISILDFITPHWIFLFLIGFHYIVYVSSMYPSDQKHIAIMVIIVAIPFLISKSRALYKPFAIADLRP